MKNYIAIVIVIALLIACIPIYVFASDITNADFYGLILISNNSTAATNVATVMTLSVPQLVSAGYVDSDLDGCVIRTAGGTDAVFMPGYSTNPWCIFVPSISTNSSFYDTLYTSASADFGATKYYFPSTAGMAVTDNANLELGDLAFNITIEGFFDTSASSIGYDIIYKEYGVKLYVKSAGIIEFIMYWTGGSTVATQTANLSSGEHKLQLIRTPAATGNVSIYIDDALAATVDILTYYWLDTSYNWEYCNSPALTYVEYISHNVTDTNVGYWSWEYDSKFYDQSGNGNTATPSFRTTSSDADVTANLTTFAPINPAQAPSTSVTNPGDFYTGNITATADFTSSNVTTSNVPGYAVIEQVSDDGGLPGFWLWGILSSCLLAVTGVGLSYARRRYGISGGYVTAIIIGVCLIFGFLITTGVFDWWMLWYFAIIGAGIAVASRHIDLGGSTSQHAWIGFLATTWVILTLINRIMEGYLLTSAETSFLNDVSFTQAFNVLGVFTMPIINFSFFTEGIPALLRWDYTMFGGQAQILQYMLYSFTAVVSFIVFIVVIGLVYSFFSRIR